MSCPWVGGEPDPESLQIGVVLWAGILLWRNKGGGKPCICDRAVEREKPGGSANTPEYDRPSDRMDPLGQRDQAGNACDDDREQAHGHQHSEADD